MIEIFRTDVNDHQHAAMLVEIIHTSFPGYCANFDLKDCDNILRIASKTEPVKTTDLVQLLAAFGFHAEVLPDEIPAISKLYKYALFRRAMVHTS